MPHISATDAHMLSIQAQAVLATRSRQQTGGRPLDDGTADRLVGEEEAGFAQAVVSMAETISGLQFEIRALKGALPAMPAEPTPHQLHEAGVATGAEHERTAEFYGYHGRDYHLMLGDDSALERRVLSGDGDAARLMAIRCNVRAREILRLNAVLLAERAPALDDCSAEAVMARGITGARYAVLLTDATLLGERAVDDVMALGSLATRCMARSSAVMDMAMRVIKQEQGVPSHSAPVP